jgi:hypothetical protein
MENMETLIIILLSSYVTISYLYITASTLYSLSYKYSTEEEVAKAFFIIIFAPLSLPILMFLEDKTK